MGMTSVFDDQGRNIPVTVIEASPNVVTQVKKKEKDGYESVQLAFNDRKAKNVSQAMQGHFKKAGTTPKTKLAEFVFDELEKDLGSSLPALRAAQSTCLGKLNSPPVYYMHLYQQNHIPQ